jgi:hypothetical protein
MRKVAMKTIIQIREKLLLLGGRSHIEVVNWCSLVLQDYPFELGM